MSIYQGNIKVGGGISKSPYQYAVDHGFSGTENEFYNALATITDNLDVGNKVEYATGEKWGEYDVYAAHNEYSNDGIGTFNIPIAPVTISAEDVVSFSASIHFSEFPVSSNIIERRTYNLPVKNTSGDIVMDGYINNFGKLVITTSEDLGAFTVRGAIKYIKS